MCLCNVYITHFIESNQAADSTPSGVLYVNSFSFATMISAIPHDTLALNCYGGKSLMLHTS